MREMSDSGLKTLGILLKVEYAGLFIASILLFTMLPYPWWLYLVLFPIPDIGIVGYLINVRVGSITYNATHFLGIAVLFYVAGTVLAIPVLALVGVVMFGHSGFDRMLGLGLKLNDSFTHTHLSAFAKKQ